MLRFPGEPIKPYRRCSRNSSTLTNTQAGWLAGIVSAGYMLAVVPLVSLTDRQPARHIYLASSALGALSCFGMVLCDSLLPALGFRTVAGVALAGMYMPGLQALTAGIAGTMRARIAAWYTSARNQTDGTGQRSSLAIIASADLVQTKGLGLALCSVR
jgi:MFS family permease